MFLYIQNVTVFVPSCEVMTYFMYFPSVVSICFQMKINPQTSEACMSRNCLLSTKLYPANCISTQKEACIHSLTRN